MSDPAPTSPDLHDQVIVVTGGNSGIGKEAAVALAAMGATVVITARNAEKGADALAEIQRRSGQTSVEVMALDLADFASIRSFAAELQDRHDRLDVLVNNAGGILSERLETAQHFEMTFGVNHLGHFLLTDLLVDRLKASAPARVINVSSFGHRFAYSGLDFADLQSERRYWSMDAYGKSKLANILFTRELAQATGRHRRDGQLPPPRCGAHGLRRHRRHERHRAPDRRDRFAVLRLGRAGRPHDRVPGLVTRGGRPHRRLLRPLPRAPTVEGGPRSGGGPPPVGDQRAARRPAAGV